MKIKMKLLADTIFGNGSSVPGGEDIAVLSDEQGFPYYKGSTFKGIFREELLQYYLWTGKNLEEAQEAADQLLGFSGDDGLDQNKLVFSDFSISDNVKQAVCNEIGNHPNQVLEAFTNLRTFTAIDSDGIVKKGSMRVARCVNKGMILYGEICCNKEQESLVKEILGQIKWLGTSRNRGFGKVRLEEV